MKKVLLIVLIVLELLSGVVSFFTLLGANWLVSLLVLAIALLNLVPLVVLIEHMEQINNLRYDVSRLQTKVRLLEKQLSVSEDEPTFHPSVSAENIQPNMTAASRWACVKCGAVNREHTTVCENCGARYSDEQESVVDSPLTKWKLKNKKKK